MFCTCRNAIDQENPNTHICPICTGQPGTLPVVNREAIHFGLKAALALNCTINQHMKFDRKNYFYPDLPKGYQISQFDEPLAEHGYFDINFVAPDGLAGRLDNEDEMKRIGITRIHLEEDSAKSIHDSKNSLTLVDYNRGGAPLIEIVTEPHFSQPSEAKTFAQELQLLMRQLGVSNADMEKGELRCDANISLRPVGDKQLYPKTEVKNINSFRSLEKALEYEVERQKLLWIEGHPPTITETRGFDDKKLITVSQRDKEDSADYRYFPEPDIPPFNLTDTDIETARRELGELPQGRRARFMDMYNLTPEEAKLLTYDDDLAKYTEQVMSELENWANDTDDKLWSKEQNTLMKLAANWLTNTLISAMNDKAITFDSLKITAENFAELIVLVFQKKVTNVNAMKIFSVMINTGADPSHVMDEQNLAQTSDSAAIEPIVQHVIDNFPDQVAEFRAGKEPIIKFLLGQVMKHSQGKAEPVTAEKLLREKLK